MSEKYFHSLLLTQFQSGNAACVTKAGVDLRLANVRLQIVRHRTAEIDLVKVMRTKWVTDFPVNVSHISLERCHDLKKKNRLFGL